MARLEAAPIQDEMGGLDSPLVVPTNICYSYTEPCFKPKKGGPTEQAFAHVFLKLNSWLVQFNTAGLQRLSSILGLPTRMLTQKVLNEIRIKFNELFRPSGLSIRRNPRLSEYIVCELLKYDPILILKARDAAIGKISELNC